MNHPELSIIINAGHINNNSRNNKALENLLEMMIKTDTWMWLPVLDLENGEMAPCIVKLGNDDFVVVFSEDKYAKHEEGVSFISTPIQRIVDYIMNQPGLMGFVINPFVLQYRGIITKRELERIIAK